jgi:hypothetical protein
MVASSAFSIFQKKDVNIATIHRTDLLKELSHETEMGSWWYGWIEPYSEMNL